MLITSTLKYQALMGNFIFVILVIKSLKKGEIPAQAVSNKLNIFDLPEHLANMNRLEKNYHITSYFIQKNYYHA